MKRRRVIELIHEGAPPKPPCFDSHWLWQQWLAAAHETGIRIVRRVDIGKSKGDRITFYELLPTNRVDYCAECENSYREVMAAQDRCHPCDAEVAARGRQFDIPTLTDEVTGV